MTPDSPKGPENQEAPLRERISRAIQDEAAVWEEQFNAGPGIVCSVSDASVVAARLVESELERLTAEVERLRSELEMWTSGRRRKAWPVIESVPDGIHYAAELARAQGTEGGEEHDRLLREASQRLKALHDVAQVLLADRDVLSAEVSRLREQLAAQPKVPQDAEDQLRIAIADPGSRLPRIHYTPERASEPVSRWSTRAVLDLLKSWGVSFSEVEAPRPKLPHHNVTLQSENVKGDEWEAYCHECTALKAGTMAEVRFWRDQHEADTLVPQVGGVVKHDTLNGKENGAETFLSQEPGPPGLVLPQKGEGRPSGSERLAPRPMETGLVLVSRAELVSGMLVGISGEHDPVPTQQQLDRAADLIIRAARRRDRTKEGQVRLLAVLLDHQCAETGCTDKAVDGDVVCSEHLVPDEPEQDAAQAARSEAAPEELPEVDPDAFGFAGYLLQPPSPSLRKEGGDRE